MEAPAPAVETLRAGKPSIITPFGFDQFDTAARMQNLGLGRWMTGEENSVALMAAALDSTLRDASLAGAAHDAAMKIAAAPDGAERAAELIEIL
jgi:rhamnosyltransferase subunit B